MLILQDIAAALIVTACIAYAAWTLMPAFLRQRAAAALLKWPWPWPETIAARLRKHTVAASGCACDGCDQGTKNAAAPRAEQPVRFHPRPPR